MSLGKKIDSLLWNVFRFNTNKVYLTLIGPSSIVQKHGVLSEKGYLTCEINSTIQNNPEYEYSPEKEAVSEITLSRGDVNLVLIDRDYRVVNINSEPNLNTIRLIEFSGALLSQSPSDEIQTVPASIAITISNDFIIPEKNAESNCVEEWIQTLFSSYCKAINSVGARLFLELMVADPTQLSNLEEAVEELERVLKTQINEYNESKHTLFTLVEHQLDTYNFISEDPIFFVKPIIVSTMLELIFSIITKKKTSSLNVLVKTSADQNLIDEFHELGFIGRCNAMIKVFKKIKRYRGNSSILITGEPGTGKELVAKALHDFSDVTGDFVPVNASGQNNQEILYAEIFGARAGMFTGVKPHEGSIEQADNGTLFLDEIGNISISIQQQLLRVLQERKIKLPGDEKEKNVNFKLITATNVDLSQSVKDGKIQQDFFSRISKVTIKLPSLNDRAEDVPILAEYLFKKHFKEIYSSKDELSFSVPEATFNTLKAKNWDGTNVRGLDGHIELAVRSMKNYLDDPKKITQSIICDFIENPDCEYSDPLTCLSSTEKDVLCTLVQSFKTSGKYSMSVVGEIQGMKHKYKSIIHDALIKLGYYQNFDIERTANILESQSGDLIETSTETKEFLIERFNAVVKESKKEGNPKLYHILEIPKNSIAMLIEKGFR